MKSRRTKHKEKKIRELCNWKKSSPECDCARRFGEIHYKCRWHRIKRNIEVIIDINRGKLMNFQFDYAGFTFVEPLMDERGQWPPRTKNINKTHNHQQQTKIFIYTFMYVNIFLEEIKSHTSRISNIQHTLSCIPTTSFSPTYTNLHNNTQHSLFWLATKQNYLLNKLD